MATNDLSQAAWRRSTYSGQNGNCVEVARDVPGVVAVRDSRDRSGAVLMFAAPDWRDFMAQVKAPDFGR